MNLKDVADQIEKKAGVNVTSLPVGRRFMTRAPDGQMVLIKVGEPWPVGKLDGSLVISLFQEDDDVRVYTLAVEAEAGKEPAPPTRYTISKHAPSIFSEMMTIETFIDEIANEWVMLDEGISTGERERAAVVSHLNEVARVPPWSNTMVERALNELAAQIEAGEHLEDDEEDDDVKTVVPSASPPAAS